MSALIPFPPSLPCASLQVPVTAAERFRVEITFSPGAAYNPVEVVPARNNHVLPVVPRVDLNQVGLYCPQQPRTACSARV